MRTVTVSLAAIPLLLLEAGCNRSARDYVEKGNQWFHQGKYADAELEYRNAIQKDPNYGEAHFRLGLTEMEENKGQQAYQPLLRGVQLMPDNDTAKVKLADLNLALLVADPHHPKAFYDGVDKLAGELLNKNPSSFDGLRLKASLLLIDRKPAEAIQLFEKADRIQPHRPDLILSWVQALFEDNRFAEGERLAAGVIQTDKTFGSMYDVLYRHYMSVNRASDAENILKQKVSNNPRDLDDVLQLARHYAAMQKFTAMNEVLQLLLSHPKDFQNTWLRVGDFYASAGQWEQASSLFEDGARANPRDKLIYEKRLTDALLAQGRNEDAARTLEQILTAAPNDRDARRVRATLRLRSGEPKQAAAALTELRELVSAKPDDARLRFLLGQAYLDQNNPDLAANEFQAAARLRPDDVPSRLALANINLSRHKPDETIRYANEVLGQHADDAQANLLHVSGLIAAGYHRQARAELERLLREYPESADLQYELALLNVSEKRFGEAERVLGKLARSRPADQRSAAGMVELYVAQNQTNKALELLTEARKKSPDSRAIHRLLAATAARAGKYDLAIAEYQGLLAKEPKSIGLRMQLAETYHAKGDLANAILVLEQARQLAPKIPEPEMELASMYEDAGRYTEALAGFRRVLSLLPDNPFALNSVAFLLVETDGNLDEALRLAQRALQKAPAHPVLTDTLGWIYLKKGMKDSALQIYTRLVRQQPKNAEFRYHFAMALLENGDRKGAQAELKAALAAQPAPEISKKIKALAGQLG